MPGRGRPSGSIDAAASDKAIVVSPSMLLPDAQTSRGPCRLIHSDVRSSNLPASTLRITADRRSRPGDSFSSRRQVDMVDRVLLMAGSREPDSWRVLEEFRLA